MLDTYLGSGLPMLITLTGEQAQYLRGRKHIYKPVTFTTAEVKDASGNALPTGPLRAGAGFAAKLQQAMVEQGLSPGAIQTVPSTSSPSAAPLVSPSAIVASTPDSTPFSESDYEYEDDPFADYAESLEGEGVKDFMFIAAGMALLYILAKNRIVRL